jgi:DNA-binding protein YbaB
MPMPDRVDAAEQLVAGWNKEIQERAERYQAMARRLDERSVTESSVDKTVQVTVSSRGMLTDLTLTETAGAKGMAELSALIMRTVRQAQARIPALLKETLAETVGTDGQTASRLLAEAGEHFPAVATDPGPELWRELRLDSDDAEPNAAPRRPRRPERKPVEDEEFRGFGDD